MTPFKPTSGLTSPGMRRATEPANSPPRAELGSSGITVTGVRQMIEEATAAPLTTQQRKSLPKSDFVFPEKAPGPGSYPIDTRERGGNALSRSSGKPEEEEVERVVCKRYPDLPSCGDDKDD